MHKVAVDNYVEKGEEKMEERIKKHDIMLMGIYIVFAMVAFIVIVNHERINKIENTTSTCGCDVVSE